MSQKTQMQLPLENSAVAEQLPRSELPPVATENVVVDQNGQPKNPPDEEWRAVPGFENVFASSLGRIRQLNLKTRKWHIKTNLGTASRYWSIHTYCGPKLVHRLVAAAFIPNPENLPEVNHIDGVKHNNRPHNLEWCTGKQNVAHAWKSGINVKMMGTASHRAKLNDSIVREIFHAVTIGREFQRVVAARFGVEQTTVGFICRGVTWKHLKLVKP